MTRRCGLAVDHDFVRRFTLKGFMFLLFSSYRDSSIDRARSKGISPHKPASRNQSSIGSSFKGAHVREPAAVRLHAGYELSVGGDR
jgi:hypothetical protein